MTFPPEPPEHRPNWAFGTAMGIKCPQCGAAVDGLDWLMQPPPDNPDATPDEYTNQGMILRPCRHQLPTPPWTLTPTGGRGQLELKST